MDQELSDVGTVFVPGQGAISISQWIEDPIYDTVTLSSGAVAAGTEYEFFTTLTNKNKDDINLVEANKLPEGWEIIVMKMGLEYCAYNSDVRDVQNITNNSFLRFETGNSKVRRRAPVWCWPIGFGLYNMNSSAEAAAETRYGNLQLGGTAFASIPNLLVPIRLSPRLNFKAVLNVRNAVTLEADLRCRFYLYGYISRPVQ